MKEYFSTDLDQWTTETSDRYVVSETLESNGAETAEVVYEFDEQGMFVAGPLIRKRFGRNAGRGGAYIQMLRAQAQGRRLEHQPYLYYCGREDDAFEVVVEQVSGQPLNEYVADQGPGISVAQHVFPQLCEAVSELHTSFDTPVIHGNISPSSVILDHGKLVLMGLDATHADTPGYASPEQNGRGQVGVLSDVYALGMTLAFCLIGEEPDESLLKRKFKDPRIPSTVQKVLARATQFEPMRRHQSALALRDDFLHALEASAQQASGTFWERVLANQALTKLGRIWNVLLCAFWACVAFFCISITIKPPIFVSSVMLPVRAAIYSLLMLVPCTLLLYALCDRRRLRSRSPFSKWNWRRETIVCIGGAILSVLVSYLIVVFIF